MNRTMKLSAVAATLMAALSTQAFADDNVTIYGIVDAGVRVSTNQATQATSTATAANPASGTQLSGVTGGLTTSRLGFKGSEDLGNGLKAVFQLEAGLGVNTGSLDNSSSILFNRISHVGLTTGTQTVFVGREYTEGYLALLETDPLGFRAVPNNPNVAVGGLNDTSTWGNQLPGQTDARTNNAVRYEGLFGDLKAGAQYSAGGVAGSTNAKSSYGIRLSYNLGSLIVNGSVNRFNDDATNTLTNYTLGAKYKYTPELSLAATYSDAKVSGGATDGYDRKLASVGAYYTPGMMTYGLAYYNTKASSIGGVIGADGSQDKLVGLVGLGLSKRTTLYTTVDYSANHDALVPANTAQKNVTGLTLGLNHTF